ncbi:MAG TPA: tryptophan synthase subunit alpha [Solirubrobacterales bacterium]|nr:tryptophan synthase subunit alpha [Solirubrobacterales bacterium]
MPSGVERIEAAFAAARDEGRAALMPYLMGGFPDLETSAAVAEAYVEGGADLVELGVPYSDPLADGPTIHAAGTRALAAGTSLDDVLALCERISGRVPVLPMVYVNMALARGAERFAEALAEAGACGAIIPDLPPGEDADLPAALAERGLALIPFVAPTTAPGRRRRLLGDVSGFTYVVSLTGVTGERQALPEELGELVDAVRNESSAPAAVGFGISTPERAAEVGRHADGVIIGSRLVREVAEAEDAEAAARAVREFLAETRERLAAG